MKQLLVIHSKSLGDIICATPTLKKLYNVYNQKISIVTYMPIVFKNNPCVDRIMHYNKTKITVDFRNYEIHEIFKNVGNKENGIEKKHNIFDIRQYHATDLGFMLTPEEMTCEFYPDKNNEIDLPDKFSKGYVVLHPVQTWPSRTWSKENWVELIKLLKENNINYILIGKDSNETGYFDITKNVYEFSKDDEGISINLLNKTNLSQTWNIINNAECIITMDSGILHLAGTTNTHIIQLGSSINPNFRAPYRYGTQIYKYDYVSGNCNLLCASDMKYSIKEWNTIQSVPPLIGCLEKKQTFECHPTVEQVFNSIINVVHKSTKLKMEYNSIKEYTADSLRKEEDKIILNKVLNDKKINLTKKNGRWIENKKKLLYIVPHLSTGGLPQYLQQCIESIKDEFDVYLIEHSLYSLHYVIQRNKILSIIEKDKFWSFEMTDTNKDKIINIIDNINPDIIHLQEAPELFLEDNISKFIYSTERKYILLETTHTTTLDLNNKKYFPDKFIHVGNFINNKYLKMFPEVPSDVVEYKSKQIHYNKIEAQEKLGLDPNLKHVLNIGIFTPNKRQDYIFDMAKIVENIMNNHNIQFHFIGNQADNFKQYWEPLNKNKPTNCHIYGERDDVDYWYSACDLFLFPSKLENNPLVLIEAEQHNISLLINNLDVYENKYIDNLDVNLLGNNLLIDTNNLITILEGYK